LDAGNNETFRTLRGPASKKRQGTKSREVGHPAEQRALLGWHVGAALDGKRDASTRRRASLPTGEPRRVQWASRRAREVQQRAAGELIDGYCFERRQPGRTLPQLPRFGMSVAQEYF